MIPIDLAVVQSLDPQLFMSLREDDPHYEMWVHPRLDFREWTSEHTLQFWRQCSGIEHCLELVEDLVSRPYLYARLMPYLVAEARGEME